MILLKPLGLVLRWIGDRFYFHDHDAVAQFFYGIAKKFGAELKW